MKAYHSIKGIDTRYVVLLYSLKDGELLAVLDGRLITDMRTGAASGVMARKVTLKSATIGLLGSGNQARTQLESLAAVYPVQSASCTARLLRIAKRLRARCLQSRYRSHSSRICRSCSEGAHRGDDGE